MDNHEPRRRSFLTEPGEALLLAGGAMTLASRYQEWTEASGLPQDRTYCDALVAVPLPVRTNDDVAVNGWPSTTNPALFWHPLFWLPSRLALRYRIVDNLGNEVIESDEEWAVRVALELTLVGFYDNETGTWLDILNEYGLDIDDPETEERVRLWIHGNPDDILDNIDLTDAIDQPDTEWALTAAQDYLPSLRPASWAIIADDLITSAQSIKEDGLTADEAKESVETLASLAIGTLRDVPGAGTETAPVALWERVEQFMPTFNGTIDQLYAGPLNALEKSFTSIRDDYWPFLEAIAEEEAAAAENPEGPAAG